MRAERARQVQRVVAAKKIEHFGERRSTCGAEVARPVREPSGLLYRLRIDMHDLRPCGVEAVPCPSPHGLSDLQVLRGACLDRHRLWGEGLFRVPVVVPVSGALLQHQELADAVCDILHDTALPACRLELRLTWSDVIGHTGNALRTVAILRGQGVAITVGGVDAASWECVYGLECDRLQFAPEFVEALPHNAHHRTLLAYLRPLAQARGMAMVAAGVMTREQWFCLQELGCASALGPLIGSPQPVWQLSERLHRTAGIGWGAWRDAGQ